MVRQKANHDNQSQRITTMSDIIEFKTDTIGDNVKRVMLPFGGFYQSHYDTVINGQLSDMMEDGMSFGEVQEMAQGIDYTTHYQGVAEGYAAYLTIKFESLYGCEVNFTQTQVHPMTPQNTGDQISSAVDVTQLPTLNFLQDLLAKDVIDFKQSLKQVATDTLTSCSGFHSSWDANIERLFDKPYEQWESVYIECLLTAMVNAIHIDDMGGAADEFWQHNINDFEYMGFMDHGYIEGFLFVDNLYAPNHC